MPMSGWILPLTILAVLLYLVAKSVVIVRPYEKGLVERLGKYHREIDPGIHFIIPLVERVIKVDLREHVVDVPPQEVICKDNVVVTVDAVVYYQILDPKAAVYNVGNFLTAIVKLAQTNLRAIIGEMELDETLSGRDVINAKLQEELDKITDKWGVKVTRVEIQRIDPPQDIQDAMKQQMVAERKKRAMILESEGYKESQIKKAEGDKQAMILRAEAEKKSKILQAEAEKQAAILRAEGESEAILKIIGALSNADEKYLALKYIEALPDVARPGNMIVPYDSEVLMGLVRMLKKAANEPEPPKPPKRNGGKKKTE